MKYQFLGSLFITLVTPTHAISAYSFERGLDTVFSRRDALDSGNNEKWPARTLFLLRDSLYSTLMSIFLANPNGGKGWASAFAKANATVMQMTVEEMANVSVIVSYRCAYTQLVQLVNHRYRWTLCR